MRLTLAIALGALSMSLATGLLAAESEETTPTPQAGSKETPSQAEMEALVKRLGDDDWRAREDAQKRLAEIGTPAVPAIRKGAESSDMEVSTRCKALLKQLVGSGWMGTEIRDLMGEEGVPLDIPEGEGVVISRVLEGTPAAGAGLQAGDILHTLDGEPLRGSADLVARIAAKDPDTKVKFVLWRDGKRSEIEMTLGRRPPEHPLPGDEPQEPEIPDLPPMMLPMPE